MTLRDGEGEETETRAQAASGPRPSEPPSKAPPPGSGAAQEGAVRETSEEGSPGAGARALHAVRAHPVAALFIGVMLVAALAGGTLWYLQARLWETTDDAFVDARSFSIAPKVAGYLSEVKVTDNQHVAAGETIATIDPRDFVAALHQAEAQLRAAEANLQGADAQIDAQKAQVDQAGAQVRQSEAALVFAQEQNSRAVDLVRKGAGTLQNAQQTTDQLREAEATLTRSRAALAAAKTQIEVVTAQRASAEAAVAQSRAQVEQARLNLSYATVSAAQPGRIVRLTGAKGQLVQAGTAIAILVPDRLWVTANFKETQLADMRPGQKVDMTIDAYPGRRLVGHVDSVQPGSGTVFSLLPAQNATGNYVKVVQRVPVKLVIDDLPTDVTIGPGMSVVPSVKVR